MQIFLFDSAAPARDGALDASLVLHELTHGLSNRLIGDANGLVWDVGGGMGEGWSDFYALSLLHGSNAYPPQAEYVVGTWATYQSGGMTDNYLYGLRRFPYSTDHSVNPLTLADIDDVTYDNAGGITPSVGRPLAHHRRPGGRQRRRADRQCHDAATHHRRAQGDADQSRLGGWPRCLLTADCAANACANEESIWAGFADRGLGYGAVAPLGQVGVLGSSAYMGGSESFQLPFLDVGFVAVQDGFPGDDNSGTIEPGETANLTVDLMNPWLGAAKGATGVTATWDPIRPTSWIASPASAPRAPGPCMSTTRSPATAARSTAGR